MNGRGRGHLKEGDLAPEFEAQRETGEPFRVRGRLPRPLLLVFVRHFH